MASFQISDLKGTEVLDGSSFVPSTLTQTVTFYSNGAPITEDTTVTRKLSVQNLRTWFDSGIYKQIRSGASVKVTPENFSTSGTISFYAPGFMALYAGETAPDGWLLCDGSSKSSALYPELFGIVGYTYGGSGGSFNLPNTVGRSVFGVDNMGASSAGRITVGSPNDLGSTGGSPNHILTADQSPLVSHTHFTSGDMYVSIAPRRYGNNSGRYTGSPRRDFNTSGGGCARTLTLSIGTSTDIQSVPSTESHPNLPPFLLLNWIIKY